MFCSSVVQKGLTSPALWDSLGFSMGRNLPALPRAQHTEHLQGEDVGLEKSATAVRRIFIPFSFLLFSLAAPPAAAGPGVAFRGKQGQAALPQQGQISAFQFLSPGQFHCTRVEWIFRNTETVLFQ